MSYNVNFIVDQYLECCIKCIKTSVDNTGNKIPSGANTTFDGKFHCGASSTEHINICVLILSNTAVIYHPIFLTLFILSCEFLQCDIILIIM